MIDAEELSDEPKVYVVQPSPGEAITSLLTNCTYEIGEKIGEGSFGVVYSCTDVWNNDLAVKVLKPIGTYEKVRANAVNEFHKLMQLRHPCITFVYDAFEYRDTFYIITERCHGPLSGIIAMETFNGMSWLIPIARQLLQAVHYLHINNLVHQDIHEGNVFSTFIGDEMIPDKSKVIKFKLGDLGLSKLLGDVDWTNTRAQWMLPPEVIDPAEFGPTDHRIDIYHLGLLLLQFAYSQRFQFSNEEIIEGKPRQMALRLPSPYGCALEKSLRRHVLYRTASAMELWDDLIGRGGASGR